MRGRRDARRQTFPSRGVCRNIYGESRLCYYPRATKSAMALESESRYDGHGERFHQRPVMGPNRQGVAYMLRKILVPLDSSDYTPAAVEMAAGIANEVKDLLGKEAVTLTGLGLIDLDQLPTGRFANIVPRDEILAEAREAVGGLMKRFRQQTNEKGLSESFVETHQAEGSPFRQIMHHHVFCDLVVMGETASFPPAQNDYNTLEELFQKASRPIVITPASARKVETVVMAMDGTAPASRMMYTYAQVNPFPKAKVLIAHSRAEEERYQLTDFYDRVRDYLASFNFDVEPVPMEEALMAGLPQLAKSRNADAIALGMHPEHFMDKLRDPLQLKTPPVEQLLADTDCALFTTH